MLCMHRLSQDTDRTIFDILPRGREALTIGALALVTLTGVARNTDITLHSIDVMSAVTPDFVGEAARNVLLGDGDLGEGSTVTVLGN